MRSKYGKTAARLIHQMDRQEITRHAWGDTNDIVKVIMEVCNKEHLQNYVKDFAQKFKGYTPEQQYKKLNELWRFCRFEIQYEKDPDGYQFIKHPHRTFWDNKNGDGADCKSLSIFIYFICRSIGVPCFLRFTSYHNDKEIGHVYPVAILENGRTVPVDAVYHRFDAEEKPTYVRDQFSKVYNTPAVRQAAKQARKAAIAGTTENIDKIATGILAGLCFYNGSQQKGLVALANNLLGGYFAYKLIK